MICPNCGFQNKPGDEFCGSCGHFLAWTGSDTPATAPDDATTVAATTGGPPPPDPLAQPSTPPASPVAATSTPAPNESTGLTPVAPASGTYNPALSWPAGLQRCEVCGTANELSRTFCLNCGAKLKRAGTTTGTALAVAAAQDQRRREYRMIGYALGGILLFVVFAAGAFIVLGGLNPAPPVTPTRPPSTLIAANPSASLSAGQTPSVTLSIPTAVPPTAIDSFLPLPTPIESLPGVTLPPPTIPPSSVTPATLPPAGGFVCAPSTFNASFPGGWRINQAAWSRKGSADTLTLRLGPTSSTSTASAGANILAPDQVFPTYGVQGPSSGSVAVVVQFNDAVSSGSFGSFVGYRALQEFQITRQSGVSFLVIGANGSGCYGLTSDAWTSGSSSAPELVVSLQRP